MSVIKTMCARDCPDGCFLDAMVENGRLEKVSGSQDLPFTAGFVCPRGTGDPQRVYSPSRVIHPRIRLGSKPGPDLKTVSWDEALPIATSHLRTTLDNHGPESVLLLDYAGHTGLITSIAAQRLWHILGATRTDHSLCARSGHTAIGLHHGTSFGFPIPAPEEYRALVFWGCNTHDSAPHLWRSARKASRERGTLLAAIDARRSPTVEGCDHALIPAPGSDTALAYGIAHRWITRGVIDLPFLERFTTGFERFREEALRWPPERVSTVTALAPEAVISFADLLAERRPVGFIIGIGLQKRAAGSEAARVISLLSALLGQHRGFFYTNSRGRFIDSDALLDRRPEDPPGKTVSLVGIGSRLAAGEFRFVWVTGMNPAMTLPGQDLVRRGLASPDTFVVVHDTHLTETASYADLVLPAATFYEKEDVTVCDSHPWTRLMARAIDPVGESRDEWQVLGDLARALGHGDRYAEPAMSACERALREGFAEGSFADLRQGLTCRLREASPESYPTPSGKIEFAPKVPDDISPLPEQHELERATGDFILLNSATTKHTHSQFQDVYGPVPSFVWINPTDAAARGITSGEIVSLANDQGSVNLQTIVTDRVPPGVLWSPRPFTDRRGTPLNALASCQPQELGGGPRFNEIRVRVERLD